MAVDWVHLAPVILTDDLFFSYIGDPVYTGTSTQRDAAYLIAEQEMIQEIKTPLLPTSMTGTWRYPGIYGNPTIVLPYQKINTVDSVAILYGGGTGVCGLQSVAGCHRIKSDTYGYIDAHCIGNLAILNCGCTITDMYQVRVAFTAGLSTGIAADDKSLHMALAMIAEQYLTEIIDPGASPGGPGAPGIVGWSSLGYSEKMNPAALKLTPMGASGRMNAVRRMVRHLKKKRALRF